MAAKIHLIPHFPSIRPDGRNATSAVISEIRKARRENKIPVIVAHWEMTEYFDAINSSPGGGIFIRSCGEVSVINGEGKQAKRALTPEPHYQLDFNAITFLLASMTKNSQLDILDELKLKITEPRVRSPVLIDALELSQTDLMRDGHEEADLSFIVDIQDARPNRRGTQDLIEEVKEVQKERKLPIVVVKELHNEYTYITDAEILIISIVSGDAFIGNRACQNRLVAGPPTLMRKELDNRALSFIIGGIMGLKEDDCLERLDTLIDDDGNSGKPKLINVSRDQWAKFFEENK